MPLAYLLFVRVMSHFPRYDSGTTKVGSRYMMPLVVPPKRPYIARQGKTSHCGASQIVQKQLTCQGFLLCLPHLAGAPHTFPSLSGPKEPKAKAERSRALSQGRCQAAMARGARGASNIDFDRVRGGGFRDSKAEEVGRWIFEDISLVRRPAARLNGCKE